jgi:pyruvate/2-oxoglutarate dehydrogenase complex dihydrolipoamide dehydrogenase (E3) component
LTNSHSKPIITEIKVDKQQLKELKSILTSALIGAEAKLRRQRHLIGECLICGAIPTKLLTYDMHGAQKIEKYCDKCLKKAKIK